MPGKAFLRLQNYIYIKILYMGHISIHFFLYGPTFQPKLFIWGPISTKIPYIEFSLHIFWPDIYFDENFLYLNFISFSPDGNIPIFSQEWW